MTAMENAAETVALNGMTKGRVVIVTITGLVARSWLLLCDSPIFPSKEEFGDYRMPGPKLGSVGTGPAEPVSASGWHTNARRGVW